MLKFCAFQMDVKGKEWKTSYQGLYGENKNFKLDPWNKFKSRKSNLKVISTATAFAKIARLPQAPATAFQSPNQGARIKLKVKKKFKNTYPSWEQTVTWTESSTVTQRDTTSWRLWSVIDNLILALISNKCSEPVHQVWVTTDKCTDFVYEHVSINEILRKQVAKLQELVHG